MRATYGYLLVFLGAGLGGILRHTVAGVFAGLALVRGYHA